VTIRSGSQWIRRLRLTLKADWTGAMLGVLVIGAGLSIASPYFFTPENLVTILIQAAVVAILAAGESFVILSGHIDLSVGAVTALVGSIVGLTTVRFGLNPGIGILFGLTIGAAVGLVNGLLVTKAGLPSFIVTLAGFSLWRGLAFQITGGFDTSGMPGPISFLGRGHLWIVPMPIIVVFGVFLISAAVLRLTRFGRYVYAIGSNAEATRLAGIRVNRYTAGTFVVSGLVAGLAAVVLIGRLDSSGGTIATDLELDAIAAVILGGMSLFGGRGSVWGALLGAVLVATIRNGLVLLQVSQYMQLVVVGLVIVVAVWLDVIRQRSLARV